MLACIAAFRQLEFLRVGSIAFDSSSSSDGHLLKHVLPILPCIRWSVFRRLDIYVSPWEPFRSTRRTHLDLLCGVEMQSLVQRAPTLRHLQLSWPDTDEWTHVGLYDTQWWIGQVTARIPKLMGVVSVEIDSTPGPCEPTSMRKLLPRTGLT